jgi:ketosteroid isomerase-like protein
VSDVVRNWLAARESCDLSRLAELTAADARWVSPVVGEVSGRDAVVEQVRAGFADADAFETALLALESRGDRSVALIRNVGHRNGSTLDSLQALCLRTTDGVVASVQVAVDDPEAIEAFWAA